MTKQEIISLANAGFSAAQIAAIAAAPETPANTQAAPAAPSVQDEILKQLGILTSAVQAGGIINSNQPQQQTADDILAEIIAPPNISTQEVKKQCPVMK